MSKMPKISKMPKMPMMPKMLKMPKKFKMPKMPKTSRIQKFTEMLKDDQDAKIPRKEVKTPRSCILIHSPIDADSDRPQSLIL